MLQIKSKLQKSGAYWGHCNTISHYIETVVLSGAPKVCTKAWTHINRYFLQIQFFNISAFLGKFLFDFNKSYPYGTNNFVLVLTC